MTSIVETISHQPTYDNGTTVLSGSYHDGRVHLRHGPESGVNMHHVEMGYHEGYEVSGDMPSELLS